MPAVHLDSSASAAYVGDCSPVLSSGGSYSLTIPFDSCGTEVSQENSKLAFSNTIVGSNEAVKIDGIQTTDLLSLDVECVFVDSFELTSQEVAVAEAGHDIFGEVEDETVFKDESFNIFR